MKAGETSLQKLMNGAIQFMVPIYQRTYSWTAKECNQLWKDIIQITLNKEGMVHFIGSVVYIDLGTPIGKPQQFLLIDGQQRLTTLSLLLCALTRYIEKNKLENHINPNKIRNYFLLNSEEVGNDKYKILLTEQDKETFVRILEGTEKTLHNPSEQMLKNYMLFSDIIEQSGESIETIYEGISRLMLVSVALDKTQDNPQLIFESMNSTGKDLSQADLIRNYILMGQTPEIQNKLYTTYWRPMEQGFGQQGYTDYFDFFIRDFLTSQSSTGRICKIGEVYEAFKLNKTFATFYPKIKKVKYVSSVLAEYVLKDSYRVFPTDEEFKAKFVTKEIYKARIRNYILESLENQNHKEPISITGNGYTVEHIMPQNPNLSREWQDMLGPDWKEIQKTYLHTIGNLTLTGYNSEMSDKPFKVKQTIEGGFKSSHLRLNDTLGDLPKWDKDEIIKRAGILAEMAVKIWPYPAVTQAELDEYADKGKTEPAYTSMAHYPPMSPTIAKIHDKLDRKLLTIDVDIVKEYKQQYIAYKSETNFVNIRPSKNELTIAFNIPFDKIKDEKGLCKNYTGIGNFANNDVLLKADENVDLDYVIDLAMQTLIYQLEG